MASRLKVLANTLSPQEEAFVRLIATEGASIPEAAAHADVDVDKSTGYAWYKSERIQTALKETLSESRVLNKRMARARITKAWGTVDNALKNPNVTPTMLKAAMFTIMQANGDEKLPANDGVTFHLEVNTQLNTNALAEQQARHSHVYEGGFEVIQDEE